MAATNSNRVSKAIAYLKPVASESTRSITVSFDDAPVVRDIGNELLVTYVVDKPTVFEFVQNRHLRECGVSAQKLHEIAIENLANFARANLRIQKHSEIFAFLCGLYSIERH